MVSWLHIEIGYRHKCFSVPVFNVALCIDNVFQPVISHQLTVKYYRTLLLA